MEAIVPKTKTLVVPISTSFFAATVDFKNCMHVVVVDGAVSGPMALGAIVAARPDGADAIAPTTRAAASAELVDVMPRFKSRSWSFLNARSTRILAAFSLSPSCIPTC